MYKFNYKSTMSDKSGIIYTLLDNLCQQFYSFACSVIDGTILMALLVCTLCLIMPSITFPPAGLYVIDVYDLLTYFNFQK